MRKDKIVYCNWCIFHYAHKDFFPADACISLTDFNHAELMVFLGKSDNQIDYEVQVSKEKSSYTPNLPITKENSEYISYLFNDFEAAHNFIEEIIDKYIDYELPSRQIIFDL